MSDVNATAVMLLGPTASGKSSLAMRLAQEFPIEIISVDSAQVYRGLDIGTAKPSRAEQRLVPHHLIDICDPAESYSAGRFRHDALSLINEIIGRGRMPLLVGGTMLYFRVLEGGLAELPRADQQVRESLTLEAEKRGWQKMHQQLIEIDPAAAKKINPADSQRIQRALEVYRLTGKSISELQKQSGRKGSGRFLKIAIWPEDRKALHRRIDQRLATMMELGFVDEVRVLHERGDLGTDNPAIRSVGYRQIWAYFAGQKTLVQATRDAATATRRLAKRQMTWLRSIDGVRRFSELECASGAPIKKLVEGWSQIRG